jgi:uncharacterized protein YacL
MIIRILYVALCAMVGLYIFYRGLESSVYYYVGVIGTVLAVAIGFILEYSLRRASLGIIVGGILGFLGGGLSAAAIDFLATPLIPDQTEFYMEGRLFLFLVLGYLGIVMGMKTGKDLKGFNLGVLKGKSRSEISNKILDTSVIIDGRIADLCETGFLEGTFIIPQFVLQELQHIADSSDSLKRARGRRGLDVLHRIQKMLDIDVQIVENDYPKIREVDAKLVVLAKELGGKVMTNDLNLNKVAELQGVRVLNINELTNALKPVVLPGEGMKVYVVKEGKESGQGVAYLDDGTMIVVDNARRLIGRNINVVVTSVLQTTAGRMIFTKMREDQEKEAVNAGRG